MDDVPSHSQAGYALNVFLGVRYVVLRFVLGSRILRTWVSGAGFPILKSTSLVLSCVVSISLAGAR